MSSIASHQINSLHSREVVMRDIAMFVVQHREWYAPQKHGLLGQELIKQGGRFSFAYALDKLLDAEMIIKVVARELPDVLKLRLPNGVEKNPAVARKDLSPMPFKHYIPAPKYFDSSFSNAFPGSNSEKRWLSAESRRIWSELEQEELRSLVKTNVRNPWTVVAEELTQKVLKEECFRLNLRQEDVYSAVAGTLKRSAVRLPLSKEDERHVLDTVRVGLHMRMRAEVADRFKELKPPNWPSGFRMP